MYWLDTLHARFRNSGRFFSGGWGDETLLRESLVRRERPDPISPVLLSEEVQETHRLLEYEFPSPYRDRGLPEESWTSRFLMVLPLEEEQDQRICLHLPATGDEGFANRRDLLARPLLTLGVASVILESPFYGVRRPPYQFETYIHTVSDLWLMGLSVVAEGRAILHWLRQQGYHKSGVSGISMGGMVASQIAALFGESLPVCACIAPHSAAPVFLEGVLQHYCDWEALHPDLETARQRLEEQLHNTDLRLFPQPVRTDCCIWVSAKSDAYVHETTCRETHRAWPGSQLRWLNSGHVSSVLFRRRAFIKGISDSFALFDMPAFHPQSWLP